MRLIARLIKSECGPAISRAGSTKAHRAVTDTRYGRNHAELKTLVMALIEFCARRDYDDSDVFEITIFVSRPPCKRGCRGLIQALMAQINFADCSDNIPGDVRPRGAPVHAIGWYFKIIC